MICSNPGYPFCTGVTLAKLAAVTMDEQGNETFDTSGALDKLRKVRLTSFHEADVLLHVIVRSVLYARVLLMPSFTGSLTEFKRKRWMYN